MSTNPGYQSVKFWDRIAKRYAKRPVPDEANYQKKLEVTRSHLRPNMEVLEFGCGTGSTAIAHASYVRHIRAIDVSSKMLAIARAKAEANAIENVTFEQSTIDELRVPNDTYDAVLGLSILHLVQDKEAVIAKVYNMLKPGGVFVSSTACIADHMRLFMYVAPLGQFLGLMPMVKVFGREELERAVTDAGFEINHAWHPGKGKAVFLVAKKGKATA